jgi:hypothetical protein
VLIVVREAELGLKELAEVGLDLLGYFLAGKIKRWFVAVVIHLRVVN